MYFDFILPRLKEAYPDALISVFIFMRRFDWYAEIFFTGRRALMGSKPRSKHTKGFSVLETSSSCPGTPRLLTACTLHGQLRSLHLPHAPNGHQDWWHGVLNLQARSSMSLRSL